jgi:hypothetical protein
VTERIAVIIPVYNHARFIVETLESVLNQTRRPDRIIVIDDGSKDDSVAMMEPFKARGVEIQARENRGAHETINELVGLAAKDCQWVSILNSDDRYLPGRMEKCLEVARSNPGKSVICTRLEVIDERSNRMSEDESRARWFYGVQSIGDSGDITPAEWLGRGNFVATTSNVFARAEYLLANPFRPYRFNHDYFFLAGAAWRDQIALSNEVMMQYRVHGSNTITTKPEPLMREMLRMHLDLCSHYADELAGDASMRQRYYDYSRALWDNMSSFHAGLFQLFLAQLTKGTNEAERESLALSLDLPEFQVSPNRSIASAYNGTEPLSVGAMTRRLDVLRREKSLLQDDREALQELNRIRQRIAASRWVALGALFGLGGSLKRNEGKKPVEKLQRIKTACAESTWLKIGATLGSGAAKELRSL